MGQKVHPIGFRLGVNKDWKSHWFAKGKDYDRYLQEDLKIRDYIKNKFKDAMISKVVIERASDRLSISIYSARPGLVIGRKGVEVEGLRKTISKMFNYRDLNVNVVEVKVPEVDAQLVADNIARKIEQRVSHRRAMKRAVETALKMGVKGIKIYAKGRLSGAEIARKEWYLKGRVPLQTIRADIDYGESTAFTRYGTVGVKVWIYRGDIFERPTEEE